MTSHSSRYNELSHEICHHFGLGRYPGARNGDYFWSAHHPDSGWGYIGFRKRMRSNIHWSANFGTGLSGQATLNGTYIFAPDSMSGGGFTSELSMHTHYTGYSTKGGIQPNLNKAVPDASAAWGYRMWNATRRSMEDRAPDVPKQSAVWYNGATKFAKPRLCGVSVITILGVYDPDTGTALLYPALRGKWGHVYDLPSTANVTGEPRACWLDVRFAKRAPQRIAVAGKRMQGGTTVANKLHVNFAQSEQPTQADLVCQAPKEAAQTLYALSIPVNNTPMPAPVQVGKQWGYAALWAQELPDLATALLAQAGQPAMALSHNARILLDSYRESAAEMPRDAQVQVNRRVRLNRWLTAYGADIGSGSAAAQRAFTSFASQLGFNESPLTPTTGPLRLASSKACVQKNGTAVRFLSSNLCTGIASEQWVMDARGAIRHLANLRECITDAGGTCNVTLAACDVSNGSQAWTLVGNNLKMGNRCLDLRNGRLGSDGTGVLMIYSCKGGANQRWDTVPRSNSNSNSELLMLLSANHAPLLTHFATAKRR